MRKAHPNVARLCYSKGMTFEKLEFQGTLQTKGALRFSRSSPADGIVEVVIPGASCSVLARVQRDVNGPFIVAPRALLRCIKQLPLVAVFTVLPSEHSVDAVTLLPGDQLKAEVTIHHHHKSYSVVIPNSWRRGLQIRQWGQVDVEIEGNGVMIKFPAQLKLDNTQVVIGIPARLAAGIHQGDRVTVALRPRSAELDGNTAFAEAGQLHWARAPTSTPLSVERGMTVPVSTSMSTKFRAATPANRDVAWLLGFYQAEGSKTVPTFSLPQKSPWLLKRSVRILRETFGFALGDLSLEVIYGATSARDAVALYQACGVAITTVRPSAVVGVGAGHTHTGILHVRNGKPFAEAFQWGLGRIVDGHDEFSDELKGAFLVGFLDGDGTVTYQSSTMLRVSASTEREREAIKRAAAAVFERGQEDTDRGHYKTAQVLTERPLTVRDMVWLLKQGAFAAGSSRPKLFHEVYAILDSVSAQPSAIRRISPEQGAAFRRDLAPLDDEWAYVKSIYPTPESTRIGRKGVLYCYPGTVW